MKEQEIIEGNKLIAEFMGMDRYVPPFNSSWGWLMPVVGKITLTNEYWITISNACVEIGSRNEESSFIISTQTCTPHYISACYYAVVDFIKWYNNQPNQ